MKKLIILVLSLLITQSAVANEMADYKCHVKTSEGDTLMFYKWKVKHSKRMAASLVGQPIEGGELKRTFIKSVEECKLDYEQFTSGRAQHLDKITPR